MALRYEPPLRAVVGIAGETTCVDSNAPVVGKFVGMSNVDRIRPGRRRNVALVPLQARWVPQWVGDTAEAGLSRARGRIAFARSQSSIRRSARNM
jgi:hypothetical protein